VYIVDFHLPRGNLVETRILGQRKEKILDPDRSTAVYVHREFT
jgi:hypothetical protein